MTSIIINFWYTYNIVQTVIGANISRPSAELLIAVCTGKMASKIYSNNSVDFTIKNLN